MVYIDTGRGLAQCCPYGSNNIIPVEDMGVGCCDDTENDPLSPLFCCDDHCVLDTENNVCIETCPCEGCCDYDCCDQVDYFMHRAYAEVYQYEADYPSYTAFYNDWYNDFYNWWDSGILATY